MEATKAKLIMTAIESIQYVAGGQVMRRDLAQELDITEDEAASKLAGLSTELCEPLWEAWRKAKQQLNYDNSKPV